MTLPATGPSPPRSPTAILLLSCPDQRGVVASVADFVYQRGGNIVDAEQHTDSGEGVFFQRIEFELGGFELARDEILPAFAPVAERFGLRCDLRFSDQVTRVGILVSNHPHCLFDLLSRCQTGELPIEVPLVVSNHEDHADAVRAWGIPFHHRPITPATRQGQESEVLTLLDEHDLGLVVLARYMQILSPFFVGRWRDRLINIHHSFLPAFVGARPYHQAHDRGVKLIGVTAHYATEELDDGPIIEQDVVRVTHRDSVDELVRKGRDLEKVVLARAVRAHVEHRVLVYGRKTVVFG